MVPLQTARIIDSVAVALALLVPACSSPPAAPNADATPSAWTAATPVIDGAIQETGAVAVGGMVVVVGGFDAELRVLPSVRLLDTASGTWSRGPSLPLALHHANVGAVGGAVYVLGALEGQTFTATGRSFRWAPGLDDSWTELAPMPAGTERGSSVVAALDGLLYVAGGLRDGAVTDVSTYDPVADRWSGPLPPLPAPRDHACGGALAGNLVVAGGRNGAVATISPAVYRLAPGGSWVQGTLMPTARGGAAAASSTTASSSPAAKATATSRPACSPTSSSTTLAPTPGPPSSPCRRRATGWQPPHGPIASMSPAAPPSPASAPSTSTRF
jgi:hypothetical protein